MELSDVAPCVDWKSAVPYFCGLRWFLKAQNCYRQNNFFAVLFIILIYHVHFSSFLFLALSNMNLLSHSFSGSFLPFLEERAKLNYTQQLPSL